MKAVKLIAIAQTQGSLDNWEDYIGKKMPLAKFDKAKKSLLVSANSILTDSKNSSEYEE